MWPTDTRLRLTRLMRRQPTSIFSELRLTAIRFAAPGSGTIELRPARRSEIPDDLRVPPGNRLEALKGDRGGQHSIRVNDQFRVCFRWTDAGVEDVEIVDYH